MQCYHCGLKLNGLHATATRNNKKERFCDDACVHAQVRESSKNTLQEYVVFHKQAIADADDYPLSKKFHFVNSLFFTSLLERKPLSQILKLQQLMKKSITDIIEAGMEDGDDESVFMFGEMFKVNNDALIYSWCAP